MNTNGLPKYRIQITMYADAKIEYEAQFQMANSAIWERIGAAETEEGAYHLIQNHMDQVMSRTVVSVSYKDIL